MEKCDIDNRAPALHTICFHLLDLPQWTRRARTPQCCVHGAPRWCADQCWFLTQVWRKDSKTQRRLGGGNRSCDIARELGHSKSSRGHMLCHIVVSNQSCMGESRMYTNTAELAKWNRLTLRRQRYVQSNSCSVIRGIPHRINIEQVRSSTNPCYAQKTSKTSQTTARLAVLFIRWYFTQQWAFQCRTITISQPSPQLSC